MRPEYRSTVYRELFYTGDISGGLAAAGGMGDQTVVVSGRPHLHKGDQEGDRRNGGVGGGGVEGGRSRYDDGGRQEAVE